MSMRTEGIFKFGEFQIDALARTLRRDEAIVTLNRRAFDDLMQNPGKVVTPRRQSCLEGFRLDRARKRIDASCIHMSEMRVVTECDRPCTRIGSQDYLRPRTVVHSS